MNDQLLIKFEANYDDEFKILGLTIMLAKEWDDIDSSVKLAFGLDEDFELTFEFGDWKNIYFNSYQEWRDCYKYIPLEDSTKALLLKHGVVDSNISGEFFIPEIELEDEDKDDEF